MTTVARVTRTPTPTRGQQLGLDAFWGKRDNLMRFLNYQDGYWQDGAFHPGNGMSLERAMQLAELLSWSDGAYYALLTLD